MKKIKIFIGSSKEGEDYNLQVRSLLEHLGASPKSWRGSFKPGEYTINALFRNAAEIDAAILVASPDDETNFRNEKRYEPRDNILFEAGFFIAELGLERTLILRVVDTENNKITSLPTNLAGLTHVDFYPNKPANNEKELSQWLNHVKMHSQSFDQHFDRLSKMLRGDFINLRSKLKENIVKYILRPLKADLNNALQGIITLTPGEYYQDLYHELNIASINTKIIALNTLSPLMWSDDPNQQKYIKKNVEIAAKGITIKRLFINKANDLIKMLSVIKELLKEERIRIKQLIPDEEYPGSIYDDMVIFYDDDALEIRAYISSQAINNPRRLRSAKLVLDERESLFLKEAFFDLWNKANEVTLDNIDEITNIKYDDPSTPPGEFMRAEYLNYQVETCFEAANAKCIPLKNELKTIIMQTTHGIYAVHLRGDKKVANRIIKNVLECDHAHQIGVVELKKMGLSHGTVSAVLNPVWSLPHLISKQLLELDYVSTNNGTLSGYFTFSPKILLRAESASVEDF